MVYTEANRRFAFYQKRLTKNDQCKLFCFLLDEQVFNRNSEEKRDFGD
jgi:hypothetical protein